MHRQRTMYDSCHRSITNQMCLGMLGVVRVNATLCLGLCHCWRCLDQCGVINIAWVCSQPAIKYQRLSQLRAPDRVCCLVLDPTQISSHESCDLSLR